MESESRSPRSTTRSSAARTRAPSGRPGGSSDRVAAMAVTSVEKLEAGGLTLAYRELGSGPPVLLLHGWPMSSFLWRDVMPPIARQNRVIALDLPGFGGSDKPLGVAYDFELFERAIDAFLGALEVD